MQEKSINLILGLAFMFFGFMSFVMVGIFFFIITDENFPKGLFFMIPFVNLAISAVCLRSYFKKANLSKHLKQFGKLYPAEVINIEMSNYRVNGRKLQNVVVQVESGRIYKSHGVLNPSVDEGDLVYILIDPNDPDKYEVQL